MSGFSEAALEKKLAELNNSQQSIQTLSLWLIHHRKHHVGIVKIWLKEFSKGSFHLPIRPQISNDPLFLKLIPQPRTVVSLRLFIWSMMSFKTAERKDLNSGTNLDQSLLLLSN